MTITDKIGINIRHTRERKGMTLTALADKVGVAKSTIHRLENGVCEHTSLSTFIKIAEELGVSLDELVKEPITKTYRVPVVFQSWGLVDVEAVNRDDLLKKLNDKRFVDEMSLPDKSDYVDDSFEIDFESLGHYAEKEEN